MTVGLATLILSLSIFFLINTTIWLVYPSQTASKGMKFYGAKYWWLSALVAAIFAAVWSYWYWK